MELGCRFLLQGIFPTQGLNLCLLHWQADSLPQSQQGSPYSLGYFILSSTWIRTGGMHLVWKFICASCSWKYHPGMVESHSSSEVCGQYMEHLLYSPSHSQTATVSFLYGRIASFCDHSHASHQNQPEWLRVRSSSFNFLLSLSHLSQHGNVGCWKEGIAWGI